MRNLITRRSWVFIRIAEFRLDFGLWRSEACDESSGDRHGGDLDGVPAVAGLLGGGRGGGVDGARRLFVPARGTEMDGAGGPAVVRGVPSSHYQRRERFLVKNGG